MKQAALDMQFERAALIRDQLIELKKDQVKVPRTITAKEVK
jgi:excinuclease UvrABC helicase subunit UvrB